MSSVSSPRGVLRAAQRVVARRRCRARVLAGETPLGEARARAVEARFRAALDASPDACFLFETLRAVDGRVVDFRFVEANAASGALYGLDSSALIGRSLCEVFPMLRGSAILAEYVRVAETGTMYEGEYRTRDARAAAGWLGLQVVALRTGHGAIIGLAVTARDITVRKQADTGRRLLYEVTHTLGATPDAAGALGAVLAAMCEATSMPYGEAWLPHDAGNVASDVMPGVALAPGTLVRGPTWHAPNDDRLAAFADASAAYAFAPGRGLPGRAAAERAAVWMPDLNAPDIDYPRRALAHAAGLRSGLAVPVIADGELVAVLSFQARDAVAAKVAELEILSVVGAQLGTVLRRRQAEAELANERTFLKAVLDSLSEGIVVHKADSDYRLFNRATREFHAAPVPAEGVDSWSGGREDIFMADGETPMPPERLPLFRVLQEQVDVSDVDMVIAPRNGPPRTVVTNARVIRGATGKFLGAVAASRDVTAQKAAESELANERAFADSVLNSLSECVSACDADGRLILFNRATRELHGLPANGTVRPEDWSAHYAVFRPDGVTPLPTEELPMVRVLATGRDVNDVVFVVAAGGDAVPGRDARTLVANARVLRGPEGEVRGAVCAARDMTAQHAAERAVRESEARFRGVLEQLRVFAVQVDAAGRITFVNDALLHATGWTRDEVVGTAHYAQFMADRHDVRRRFARVVAVRDASAVPAHVENEIITRDGARRRVAWDNVVLHDAAGRIAGIASIGRDVTDERHLAAERERLVAALADLAEQDDLTGLANRRGFARMAEQERRGAARTGRVDAVCCVDLDRFKAINDTFGHAAGDDALRAVAGIIRDTIRGADFAARLGGDEFAVYAVGVAPNEGPRVIVSRLHAALAAHNRAATAAGRAYEIAYSVGVTEVAPEDTMESALARADAVLYAAKSDRVARV